MEKHSHGDAWGSIAILFVFLFCLSILMLALFSHKIDVIYDRVGEMQREIDCWPDEVLVTDHDGNEYCVELEER